MITIGHVVSKKKEVKKVKILTDVKQRTTTKANCNSSPESLR